MRLFGEPTQVTNSTREFARAVPELALENWLPLS